MDRCALAYQYHKEGFNCAQCVVGAFSDLTGVPMETAAAAAGGMGGGVGGSRRLFAKAGPGRQQFPAAGPAKDLLKPSPEFLCQSVNTPLGRGVSRLGVGI